MKQFLLLIPLLLSLNAYAIDTLAMVTEDLPPYAYMESGHLKGRDIEIIQVASERLGINVKITLQPWIRALESVQTGEYDAMFSMYKTTEREKFLYFTSEPLGSEKAILFTNKKSTKQAKKLTDLAGWNIALLRGNSWGKDFDEYKDIRRHEVSTFKQIITMVEAGNRIDAAVVSEYNFAYSVKTSGKAHLFKKLDFIVANKPLYLGFSKAKGISHKQLAEDYRRILNLLKQEGIIEKIIQKYTVF